MEQASTPSPSETVESNVRVSTLELFFDLVFVFTITQLTAIIAAEPTWARATSALLMLGVIYWMYDGYAWLTNVAGRVDAVRRALLLAGMGGFLLIALSIPAAFQGSGWAFGVGYFVVNAIHSGLMLRVAPGAMRQLAPLNLLSASLVLVGGFAPENVRALIWLGALLVMVASPYLHPLGEWSITSSHFVERHGLIVIIALGESVVAIGAGAAGLKLTASLVVAALLGLILAFGLWWLYFGGDDEAAERALEATPSRERGRKALHAFGFAHYPLLFGVVVFAAGVKKAMLGSEKSALLLGAGVALFLLGDAWFRRVLRIGTTRYRVLGAIAALLTVLLGLKFPLGQMLVLAIVLSLVLGLEKNKRSF